MHLALGTNVLAGKCIAAGRKMFLGSFIFKHLDKQGKVRNRPQFFQFGLLAVLILKWPSVHKVNRAALSSLEVCSAH